MTVNTLKLIWQPIQIGKVEVKNRVVRTATTSRLFPHPIDADFIGYHVARARGGVGLSFLDAAGVHPNMTSYAGYLVNKDIIPSLSKLVDAVRPYGTRLIQQLQHLGHNPVHLTGDVWGASALPGPGYGVVPVPMGQQEIDEVVQSFAQAAVCCREAGLDGVELAGGHGYLIQQFLSPLTNQREDGYNGSLLKRARFVIEILQAIRAAAGDDFPLGVRFSPSLAKGGFGGEDLATVVSHLEAEKLVDFVSFSCSDYFESSMILASHAYPPGYELPYSEPARKALKKIPRIVTGRFRALDEAEQVLREGQADMVSLTRQHIADPDVVRKTQEGRTEDIRPCIGCLQGCFAGVLTTGMMQCTVNPVVGFEGTLDEELITKVESPKRVVIIGGGPAGMEAARMAALRGHKVSLFEASPKLGGALLTAKRAPYLHIFGDFVQWLEGQVYKLGIDVHLNSYVEADDVLKEKPDAVIIATGAMNDTSGRQMKIPAELPFGMDLPHVMDADTALMSEQNLKGKHAVIFDDVGRYQAIAATDYLVKAGATITFVTSQGSFAPKMFATGRDDEAYRRLQQTDDFNLLVRHYLVGVEKDHCVIRPYGSQRTVKIPANLVVVVTTPVPIRNLYDELRSQIPTIRLIGDASSPSDLTNATHAGHRCGRAI